MRVNVTSTVGCQNGPIRLLKRRLINHLATLYSKMRLIKQFVGCCLATKVFVGKLLAAGCGKGVGDHRVG